jgi:hypothetical protein
VQESQERARSAADSEAVTIPPGRRIPDSLPHHAETGWIGAALCLAASAAISVAIGFPPVIDPADPEFTPAVLLPAILLAVGVV